MELQITNRLGTVEIMKRRSPKVTPLRAIPPERAGDIAAYSIAPAKARTKG
jgi:hypothetical protein